MISKPISTLPKPAVECLKLCTAEGDLFGLGLALEAAAGNKALVEDCAAGEREQARLEDVVRRYWTQQNGSSRMSSRMHVEHSKVDHITHSLRVDSAGHFKICTMVSA